MPVSSVSRPMGRRRLRAMLGAASAAILMTFGVGIAVVQSAAPAAAATVSFSQCNNHEAMAPGAATASTCSVTIVNTIDATGDSSAVVYVRACALGLCTGDVTSTDDVINAVHQCNASNNAGGSATVCSVDIINNISASAPAAATALTLNQCVGSGAGDPAALMTGCIESTQGYSDVDNTPGGETPGGETPGGGGTPGLGGPGSGTPFLIPGLPGTFDITLTETLVSPPVVVPPSLTG